MPAGSAALAPVGMQIERYDNQPLAPSLLYALDVSGSPPIVNTPFPVPFAELPDIERQPSPPELPPNSKQM